MQYFSSVAINHLVTQFLCRRTVDTEGYFLSRELCMCNTDKDKEVKRNQESKFTRFLTLTRIIPYEVQLTGLEILKLLQSLNLNPI